jgi:hypothetical protein
MSIVDHVLVNVTINSSGLARNNFGELGILSHRATWAERVRRYKSTTAAAADWSTTSPEYRAIASAIAQNPGRSVAVLRAAGTLTQRYDVSIVQLGVGSTYAILVEGDGVTATTISYTTKANLDFVPGDVTTGTDTIAETAHGMTAGDGPYRLSNAGGGLPAGTAVDTNYWIIAPTADTYKLASSKANALANTPVDITTAGTGTHTLLRAANDVVIAQLVQGANAVTGANYTATQVAGTGDTDTLRGTGNAVNNWFSWRISTPVLLAITQSHAAPSDVTLATDLANILNEDSGWYCLTTLYNSKAYALDAAAWAQSNGRIYTFDSVDSAIETTAASGGTDVGKAMLDLGYSGTLGTFYPQPAAFEHIAAMAEFLSFAPGAATYKYKTLEGVAGLTQTFMTDTHRTNIKARRMNSYVQELPDRAFTWEGTVFSTVYKFIDVRRSADWLKDILGKNILGVFVANPIVPYSPEGLLLMEGAIRKTGDEAEAAKVILPGWTVQMPVFEEISSDDKENRNLNGCKLVGVFQGAIHTVFAIEAILTF